MGAISRVAILAKLCARFAEIRQGVVVAIVPPPIQGLGVAGGFDMRLQDRSGVGLEPLGRLAALPDISRGFATGRRSGHARGTPSDGGGRAGRAPGVASPLCGC